MLQEYQGEIARLRRALEDAQAAAQSKPPASPSSRISEEAIAAQLRAKLEAEWLQQQAATQDKAQEQVGTHSIMLHDVPLSCSQG